MCRLDGTHCFELKNHLPLDGQIRIERPYLLTAKSDPDRKFARDLKALFAQGNEERLLVNGLKNPMPN